MYFILNRDVKRKISAMSVLIIRNMFIHTCFLLVLSPMTNHNYHSVDIKDNSTITRRQLTCDVNCLRKPNPGLILTSVRVYFKTIIQTQWWVIY